MAKQPWQIAEEEFEARYRALGKSAYLHRLVDAAEVHGRTGRIGLSRAMPADYVVVHDGVTHFAEVKSSKDKTAFRFSLLRDKQSAAARMILAAGGGYLVYVKSHVREMWFRFPYALVLSTTKASIPWAELESYVWHPSMT